MLKLQPRLPYNLIGHNYEIIANMCSGNWTESYQVRGSFGARAWMTFARASGSAADRAQACPVRDA
ncbi:MAG TPA: hypothetical protein VGH53_16735 [Streptosporangiaceae bacterium]